ncbi:helix-turn-helix domain-containing protein [Microbacterium sp. Leaf179]|uniref:helix-turn-helix domain-containing protein n=1 Tax=Microbacterium sp. Leaf179 TaxID=1736288 RepID=UPI0006F6536D|nr:helix-turn-helix domain-containing protein [Microbacterium sp. Leaf179]KQR88750.1 hypothetical protein ASF96_02985 [Microbacterium sp. Leaf179]
MQANVGGPTETMVNVEYIAKLLLKSPDTIYRMARSGAIPAFKVGGEWRFFESKVIEHLTAPRQMWEQSERSRRARRITD